ncbi:MAG: hypothetical protein IPN97_04590 [Saprospiraceae bacterium]|nr:hypothetical protein [Saprospiraceae bacterium]
MISKGNSFIVSNNTISNIVNLRNGIETTAFYCSAAESLIISDNIVTNCLSKGLNLEGGHANGLLKLKGARNVRVVNNKFVMNRSALVDHAELNR